MRQRQVAIQPQGQGFGLVPASRGADGLQQAPTYRLRRIFFRRGQAEVLSPGRQGFGGQGGVLSAEYFF